MNAFRFSLQKILDLRQRTEREMAGKLASAWLTATRAAQAEQDLEAVRTAGRERLAEAHGTGGIVGHLQNLEYVLGHVDERLQDAEAAREKAREEVVESLKAYTHAHRDRNTMDKLRSKKLEAWKLDQGRSEQRSMDDAARNQHMKNKADSELGRGAS